MNLLNKTYTQANKATSAALTGALLTGALWHLDKSADSQWHKWNVGEIELGAVLLWMV